MFISRWDLNSKCISYSPNIFFQECLTASKRCFKRGGYVWAGRGVRERENELWQEEIPLLWGGSTCTKDTLMHCCTTRKGRTWCWSLTLTFNLTAGAQQRGDHGTGPSAAQRVEKDSSYLPGSCHAVRYPPSPSISLKKSSKHSQPPGFTISYHDQLYQNPTPYMPIKWAQGMQWTCSWSGVWPTDIN